jgi:hypothetical protein
MSTDGMLVFLASTIDFDPELMGIRIGFECGGCEGIKVNYSIPV